MIILVNVYYIFLFDCVLETIGLAHDPTVDLNSHKNMETINRFEMGRYLIVMLFLIHIA